MSKFLDKTRNWMLDLFRRHNLATGRQAENYVKGALSYNTFTTALKGQPPSESVVLRIAHLFGEDPVTCLEACGYDEMAGLVRELIGKSSDQKVNRILSQSDSNEGSVATVPSVRLSPERNRVLRDLAGWLGTLESLEKNSAFIEGRYVSVELSTGKVFHGERIPSDWIADRPSPEAISDAVSQLMLAKEEALMGMDAFEDALSSFSATSATPADANQFELLVEEPNGVYEG